MEATTASTTESGGPLMEERTRRLTSTERREQIRAAALEQFSKRGFHLTQMDHVAAAAGVSKALLYQHFVSKEELFVDIAKRVIANFAQRLQQLATKVGSPSERVQLAVKLLLDFVTDDPEGWALVTRHLNQPEVAGTFGTFRDELDAAVLQLLAAGTIHGEGETEVVRRAEILAPLISGSLHGLISWWLQNREVTRQEVESAACDFLWLGLERLRKGEHFVLAL